MKFVFFRIFLFFLGVIFLSYFCVGTKMSFLLKTTMEEEQVKETTEKQEKSEIDSNNSLFKLIKIIELLEKKKIFKYKGKLIKKIVLVPKLIEQQEENSNTTITIIELDLGLFKNVKTEDWNCQKEEKEKEEKCISEEITKWKKTNNKVWKKLKKFNALYAKMAIVTNQIKMEKDKIKVPGEITEKNYTVWKKPESNYLDEELIIQALILEIINLNYQDELNVKLKEMKKKNFFEVIDAKANLLLEAKKWGEDRSKRRERVWINLVISLRELKNKNLDKINIKDLNLDQFLGFWHIKEIKSKEDLEKKLFQFTDELIKDPRKIKEKKWYIITLAVGGGVIFLLIVNYIFWKFKK